MRRTFKYSKHFSLGQTRKTNMSTELISDSNGYASFYLDFDKKKGKDWSGKPYLKFEFDLDIEGKMPYIDHKYLRPIQGES